MTRTETVARIERERVVAVLRLADPDKLRAVIDALAAGGVRVFEVTMTVPGAIRLIEQLARDLPPDVIVGAGTVIDVGTARLVVDAGAMFVVSPVFKREVIDACHNSGVPAMPGCFTPTEILEAWEAGADIVGGIDRADLDRAAAVGSVDLAQVLGGRRRRRGTAGFAAAVGPSSPAARCQQPDREREEAEDGGPAHGASLESSSRAVITPSLKAHAATMEAPDQEETCQGS